MGFSNLLLQLFSFNKSTWFIIVFALFTSLMALLSDFYHTPFVYIGSGNLYQSPIPSDLFVGLNKITLENKQETIHLELTNSAANPSESVWELKKPREALANPKNINNILLALKNLKVRKNFHLDKINITNFSIDRPAITLTLENANKKSLQIKIGLVNSIDNTAYIFVSSQNSILQIDIPTFPLETLTTGQLIDARIIPITVSNIEQLQIYNQKRDKKNLLLSLTQNPNNQEWINNADPTTPKVIPSKVIAPLIDNTLAYQGTLILDRPSEDLKKIMEKYLNSHQYIIDITTIDKKLSSYSISTLISERLSEVKDLDKSAIVSSSTITAPILVNADLYKNIAILENTSR
ncbi:MAG: DUF4340 domain-containing protein [Oligoflexia bacterium]|nr:DUF4340 domain-containing protein [Oligoflexia bacterium]